MSQNSTPGELHYHRIIRPSDIREIGSINAMNQVLNSVRNHLQQFYGAQNDPTGNVHVVVTVEPLTDSAGKQLTTRDDRS